MPAHDPLAAIYAEARVRGALFDLTGRSKWRLSGADRVRYLNGQTTNDIRKAGEDAAMTACITTAKGRLCGVIFVSATSDSLHIDAEAELRETLTTRLERYIIADDVALADITEEACMFHLVGPAPANLAGAHVRTALRFARPGFDIIAPMEERPKLLETLIPEYVLLPDALAESWRVEAGAPRWGHELTEETLPPEAGLDQTAIDYHKGCYIGQEVISRIKSVGHVNRHLAGFTAAAPLQPGMTLHTCDAPGKTAGEITSGAWSFGLESWAALGYLKRGFANAPLLARSPDGEIAGVQIRSLPLVP